MNYCQDGFDVYFATETQQYTYVNLFGHYELQPIVVNDRPYFKFGSKGIWWDGFAQWWVGFDDEKGGAYGYGFYDDDIFCPHQISGDKWWLWDGKNWYKAGDDFILNQCMSIFI